MLTNSHKIKNSFFNFIVFCFFVILIIIGSKISSNYGIGGDEPTSRQNGAVTFNYLIELLNTKTNSSFFADDPELQSFKIPLNEYFDKDYGVAFDFPVFFIERLFKLDTSIQFYNLRRISSFLIFLLGLFSIYKIAILRYGNNIIAFLAVLLLLTTPRIFGESFYNSKDIVFMSLFSFALYKIFVFYKSPNFKSAFLAALFSALATDIRIVAIVLPFVSLSLQLINFYKKNNSSSYLFCINCFYFLFYLLLVYIFWPWLWEHPIDRFSEAFVNMSNFTRLIRWELFQGQFYPTTDLPKSYLLKWIYITTPPFYILLFVIGSFIFLKHALNFRSLKSISDNFIFDFLFLFLFFIFLTFVKRPVLYNGWRHFYFIFPFIILICLNGFNSLYFACKKIIFLKFLPLILIVSTLLSNIIHIYRHHPLEYIYFNFLAGSNLIKKYPMDYSGLSTALGLKFLLSYTNQNHFEVAANGPLSINLYKSLLLLSPYDKERIFLTDISSQPNFLLTDYQFFDPNHFKTAFNPILGYKNIYNFMIDGYPVFSIFQKIE